MPKIVDHDDRRRELAEAAWRVILRRGIDGATTREVARESGYSPGVLTHYFESKDDMLRAVLELSHSTILRRWDDILAEHEGLPTLRTFLLESIPLAQRYADETHIEISFWSRALVNDDLRTMQRAESKRFGEILRALVREAQEGGELDSAAGTDDIIELLSAVIDGLSVHALLRPDRYDAARLTKLMDAQLDLWRTGTSTP